MVNYRMKRLVTALDIGERWLKLAQAQETPKGKSIIRLAVRKLESLSEENISQAIRELFEDLKIKPNHLIISVPRHLTTVRFLNLPSSDEKEIREMVKFQAEKQIPYPKEEIIISHQIVGMDSQGYSKVMLVIVHQDVVNRFVNILKGASVQPEKFALSSQAIFDCHLFISAAKNETVVIIDSDTTNTEFIVSKNSHFIFTRSISIGTAHFKEKLDMKYKLFDEIKSSFATYEKEDGGDKITKIVLTGDASALEELNANLNASLSLPIEVIEPLKNIPLDRSLSILPPYREISLSTVLGLVLNTDKTKLNLAPPELQNRRLQEEKKRKLFLTAILLFSLTTTSWGIFAKKLHDKELILRELDQRLNQTSAVALDLEKKMQKLQAIQEQSNLENSSLNILRELYRIIPDKISLSSFTFEDKGFLTLRGTSSELSGVFDLVAILESSSCFKDVEVKYATKSKTRPADFTDFEIHCLLDVLD